MEILKLDSDLVIKGLPFVETFRAFRAVQEACFGVDLHDNYKDSIEHFSQSYRALNISITPKVCLFFIQL